MNWLFYSIVKFIRFDHRNQRHTGVVTERGIAPIQLINARHGLQTPNDLLAIIQTAAHVGDAAEVETIPFDQVTPQLPYDVPPKIWCIGLNYHSHAVDIGAAQPEEPGSFMKPASCMFPPGGEIVLPPPDVSDDVDAEGELGVIIGRTARFLEDGRQAARAIFGYTTTLDLTALDILSKNPRYLTRAKSMDTFFSFGPVVVTADEVGDVGQLEVITEHNDAVCSRDFVRNMKHGPFELVRFHSRFMTLYPGDLISTGCPKGARIRAGDRVRAVIPGVGDLMATVSAFK